MQLLDNWNKEILRLAIPSIISNVTVPLLGLIAVSYTHLTLPTN